MDVYEEGTTKLRFTWGEKLAVLTLDNENLEALGGIERLAGYLNQINDGKARGVLEMLKPEPHGWVPIIVGSGYMGPPPVG